MVTYVYKRKSFNLSKIKRHLIHTLSLCLMFYRSLFVLLYFFLWPLCCLSWSLCCLSWPLCCLSWPLCCLSWPLCCLSFFDLRLLTTPFESSNSSLCFLLEFRRAWLAHCINVGNNRPPSILISKDKVSIYLHDRSYTGSVRLYISGIFFTI